jgi:hypothetical protein
MATLPASLDFQGTNLDVVDHLSRPWLRLHQIGGALGYSSPEKTMSKLYTAHSDEFTDQMTAVVKLDTAGGRQDVRIFSLRGCHLLAMFARTERAKAFRAWVLDVLESLEQETPPATSAVAVLPRVGEADAIVSAGRCFSAYLRVGRAFGLPGAAAILRANRATLVRTGVNLMRDLDLDAAQMQIVGSGGNAAPAEVILERADDLATRQDANAWYFGRTAWLKLCEGYSADATAKLLRDLGHLVSDRDRLTKKTGFPGRPGMFVVRKAKTTSFGDAHGNA